MSNSLTGAASQCWRQKERQTNSKTDISITESPLTLRGLRFSNDRNQTWLHAEVLGLLGSYPWLPRLKPANSVPTNVSLPKHNIHQRMVRNISAVSN